MYLIKKVIPSGENADRKTREKVIKTGSIMGIVCNLFLFAVKLAAGTLANSVSVLADAFNNLSDMGSSLITIFGFKLSNAPPDREHPFGHGRVEYMSAALVSTLIILVGAELFKSSLKKIFKPEDLTMSALTFAVLAVSIVVKLIMAFFNSKLGKSVNSDSLKATALDSLTDSIATSAVLVSAAVSHFGKVNIDAYAGLAVAVFVVISGVKSLKETISPLLGTPPEPQTVEEITQIVMSFNDFHGIHDMIIHNYGPGRKFASLHVEVPATIDIVKCHEEIDLCEKVIRERTGIDAVIHMDPIDVNDKKIISIREKLCLEIEKFDNRLKVHDFRVVSGENRTNLIFDVVIPPKYELSDKELKSQIAKLAKKIDPKFECVITVDIDFT